MASSLNEKYFYLKETVTLPEDDKVFDNVFGFVFYKYYTLIDPDFFVYIGDTREFSSLMINPAGIFVVMNNALERIYAPGTGFLWLGDQMQYAGLYFSGGFEVEDEWLSDWMESNAAFIEEPKAGTEWEFNSSTLLGLPPYSGTTAILMGGNEVHQKVGTLYNSGGDTLDIYSDTGWNIIDLENSGNVIWYGENGIIYENGSWTTVAYERFKFADDIVQGTMISPLFIQFLNKNARRVEPPDPPGPTDKPIFMPHSVTFFDIPTSNTRSAKRSANSFVAVYRNTFDQWHMVPEERPIVKMPAQKTKYLEVPGSDGILDLSELLTGRSLYNNREGDFSFYILNGYDTFENIKTEIANYLHGRKKYMVLADDPSYLYEGRFEVDFENDDSLNHSKCNISYNLKPYKVRFSSTITDSEWIIEEIFPNERLL